MAVALSGVSAPALPLPLPELSLTGAFGLSSAPGDDDRPSGMEGLE